MIMSPCIILFIPLIFSQLEKKELLGISLAFPRAPIFPNSSPSSIYCLAKSVH
nr:MAG TPA: hypothetical protein [Caudoviricetes sp.]